MACWCIAEEKRAVEAERDAVASQLAKLEAEKEALEREANQLAKSQKAEAITEEEYTKRWLEGLNKSLGEPGPDSQNLAAVFSQAQQALQQAVNSDEFKQAQERMQET